MNKYEREFESLIKHHGGILVRHRKHRIYKFPDGRTLTTGATPSDLYACRNSLSDLKRVLGLTSTIAKIGQRKERVRTVQPREGFLHGVRSSTAEAGGVRFGRMPVIKPVPWWRELGRWLGEFFELGKVK